MQYYFHFLIQNIYRDIPIYTKILIIIRITVIYLLFEA